MHYLYRHKVYDKLKKCYLKFKVVLKNTRNLKTWQHDVILTTHSTIMMLTFPLLV